MIYFKGLKCKSIRVPVQRLVMILPVEEQSIGGKEDNEVRCTEKKTEVEIDGKNMVGVSVDDEDFTEEREQGVEVDEKSFWIQSYRMSLMKKHKVMKTTRTVKSLMRDYSSYLEEVEQI